MREDLINMYKDALKEAQELYLSQDLTPEEQEKRKVTDMNKLYEFIKIANGI